MTDWWEIFIITFFIGGGFTLFGWIIKSQNSGDMINFFDSKKHDKEKFSKIIGTHSLFIGISVGVIGIASIFLKGIKSDFFVIVQSVIMILGIVKTFYSALKHGKLENNV